MDMFLKARQWCEEKSKHCAVIHKYKDGEAVYK